MSPPTSVGKGSPAEDQSVADSDVLWFGIAETAVVQVQAERVVYDPQSVDDPDFGRFLEMPAKERVLCANRREVTSLAGTTDVELACNALVTEHELDAVIAKCGARGSFVLKRGSTGEWVGALPTQSVWKLGSGDVYSAAFAFSLFAGADLVEAARVASRSAAWWVATRVNMIPEDILEGGERVPADGPLRLPTREGRVYLAGPFFTVAERWLIETCRSALLDLDVAVFSPVHDVGIGGPEVAEADLRGLTTSTAVVALVDHFDAGTLYECGYAQARGIGIVAYCNGVSDHGLTMLQGTDAEVTDDLTTALYRGAWLALGST